MTNNSVSTGRKNKVNRVRKFIELYKIYRGCQFGGCNEDRPENLEFHHFKDKTATLSDLASSHTSWKRVIDELSKGDIYCAYHHDLMDEKEHGRRFLPNYMKEYENAN